MPNSPNEARLPLAFVADKKQYRDLCATESSRVIFAAYDHHLLHQFAENHVAHANLWAYLDTQTWRENSEQAWALCDTIGEAIRALLPAHVFDFGAAVQDEFVYALRYALNSATVVERCLEEHKPECVLAFGETTRVFIWDPPEPPPDLFNAAVHAFCERHNIPIRVLTGKEHKDESVYFASSYPAIESKRVSGSCPVVSLAEGLSITERALLSQNKALRARNVLEILAPGDEESLNCYLFGSLPFQPVFTSATDVQKNIDHALRSVPAFSGSAYQQFARPMAAHVARCASNAQAGRFLAQASRPRLALLGYPVLGSFRCLAGGLMQEHVSPLFINHSGLSLPRGRRRNRGDIGRVGVWGQWEKSVLPKYRRSDPENILPLGSLHRDIHELMLRPRSRKRADSQMARITILTTWTGHLYSEPVDVPGHWRAWDQLLAVIRRHPEWIFVIKPHPRYDHHDIYTSEKFKQIPNLEMFEGSLSDCMEQTDVTLAFNVMTTACLEPMARGVPLVVFDGMGLIQDCEGFEQSVALETTIEGVEQRLALLVASQDEREKFAAKARPFLDSMICAHGDESVKNYLEVIDDCLNECAANYGDRLPDPVAQWWLDVLMLLDGLHAGARVFVECADAQTGENARQEKEYGWRAYIRHLTRRAESLDVTQSEELDMKQMGDWMLRTVVWQPWRTVGSRKSEGGSRKAEGCLVQTYYPGFMVEILWRVWRLTPAKIRPSFRTFLGYVYEAVDMDALNHPSSRSRKLIRNLIQSCRHFTKLLPFRPPLTNNQ